MIPAQIIQKKRDGYALSTEEITAFIHGFTTGKIPDYQMSALAMAVCFQGMTFDETMWLTRAMVESGQIIQWSPGRFLADKHSTGGIGDKTSLIIAPLVASCGIRVPMLSGRGLGPTGGTLDKLESIPGFRTNLSLPELRHITDTVGCVITGATPEIAPADKKLYALRDVTATVSCLPLIVASIMSKKLAENVDGLVLDVKWGSGAFMKTRQDSRQLAQAMVEVGKRYGKKVVALQTDMNQPLGQYIGNALEVRESLDILAGRANPPDLMEVTLALAEEMLTLAGISNARALLEQKLSDGSALAKFHEIIAAQNGDPAAALPAARHQRPIPSPRTGIIQNIQCDQIGYAVITLGGGRKTASDKIDFAVGFEHPRKIGEHIRTGDPLLIMHYNDETRAAEAERMILEAYRIEDTTPPAQWPLIVERIT